MTALTPAAQIALGVLNIAAQTMIAARDAEDVLREEGAEQHPLVVAARRQLAAETVLSTDAFQAAIDQERQRRDEADAGREQ